MFCTVDSLGLWTRFRGFALRVTLIVGENKFAVSICFDGSGETYFDDLLILDVISIKQICYADSTYQC